MCLRIDEDEEKHFAFLLDGERKDYPTRFFLCRDVSCLFFLNIYWKIQLDVRVFLTLETFSDTMVWPLRLLKVS